MTQLTSPPPPTGLAPDMLVPVLNAIIDIYADERREFDAPVFIQGGFLQALTGVVGKARTDVSDSILNLSFSPWTLELIKDVDRFERLIRGNNLT